MKIIIFGLSITSSWGNGHATTYRGLVRELARRGHEVHFVERDVPWYAENRDITQLPGARLSLYRGLDELPRFASEVRSADAVIVGSYVPDGIDVGEWVIANAGGVAAFYDIDTPVTLAKLREGNAGYISAALIPRYQLYLSFTGGPTLAHLEKQWGAVSARPLYCAVDQAAYYPEGCSPQWDLGYLGTYSADRQQGLSRLMMQPAEEMPVRRFVVAGSQYPSNVEWPRNVSRIEHLPPAAHRRFYNRQRFTLNLTRADMIAAGYSPSVRLFEAAACGTPIISDEWPGLDTFFTPGSEIFIARTSQDVGRLLREVSDEQAAQIGQAARRRVLANHTAAHRAAELEGYLIEESTGPLSVAMPDALSLHP